MLCPSSLGTAALLKLFPHFQCVCAECTVCCVLFKQVGHNALGSGQVVDQGARLVDIALETSGMFASEGWKHISQAFESNTLHMIGLLSDGGVHSRFDQVVLTVKGAVERGAKRVRLHVLTDGRDVPDGSSVCHAAGSGAERPQRCARSGLQDRLRRRENERNHGPL
jgi:hypothetical protein